jgi:EAL domain-containing protein (putative c-di-GMP-specific phosphodiesterase class I)
MARNVLPHASSESACDGLQSTDSKIDIELQPALSAGPMRPRILVLDDDQAVLAEIADSLRNSRFTVETAGNANEFFERLKGFNPEIVLLDLMMPDQDGVDVLRLLKDANYGGQVVLLSGSNAHILATARRVAAGYGLRVEGALLKPFEAKALVALIAREQVGGTADDAKIHDALSQNEIRPHFQPKLNIRTGEIVGAEALSRWHHPEKGLLQPNGYLQRVKAAGRQGIHDYRILELSAAFCSRLNQSGHRLDLSVNFAVDVVLSEKFIDIVKDVVTRHKIEPRQLIIELTETEATENFEELAEGLLHLRLFGVQISIDDFGVGHSSFSRIQRLPISEVKIDRSFVEGLTQYSEDFTIVRTIVDLAHSFGSVAAAEGVETVATLEALEKANCDLAQGYLISPAVNEATFLTLLNNRESILPQSHKNKG